MARTRCRGSIATATAIGTTMAGTRPGIDGIVGALGLGYDAKKKDKQGLTGEDLSLLEVIQDPLHNRFGDRPLHPHSQNPVEEKVRMGGRRHHQGPVHPSSLKVEASLPGRLGQVLGRPLFDPLCGLPEFTHLLPPSLSGERPCAM